MTIALEELTILDLADYDPNENPLDGSQIIALEGDLTPEQSILVKATIKKVHRVSEIRRYEKI